MTLLEDSALVVAGVFGVVRRGVLGECTMTSRDETHEQGSCTKGSREHLHTDTRTMIATWVLSQDHRNVTYGITPREKLTKHASAPKTVEWKVQNNRGSYLHTWRTEEHGSQSTMTKHSHGHTPEMMVVTATG